MANDIIKTQWTHDGTYIFPDEVGTIYLFKVSYALPEEAQKSALNLASAAPDLLRALEEIVATISWPVNGDDFSRYVSRLDAEKEKAIIAIKKAYGEPMLEQGYMKSLKVIKVNQESIEFDNGILLESFHEQDCCESHYLSFQHTTLEDFEGLEFDLTTESFFERIPGYGISLNPTNGHPIRVPGYGLNNGYYSSSLSLVITRGNVTERMYDISDCQDISG